MRWIFLLAIAMRLLVYADSDFTPEEIASLASDFLIEGLISPLSGQIVLSETELKVRAAQDLTLTKTFVSPYVDGRYSSKQNEDNFVLANVLLTQQLKGWVLHPHCQLIVDPLRGCVHVRDPRGFVLTFDTRTKQLKHGPWGCSNLCEDRPNSAADIRNITFQIKGEWITVIWPDGVTREYKRASDWFVYRLQKETLPNGKIIRYDYRKLHFDYPYFDCNKFKSDNLIKISSCDPTGELIYASITKAENSYLGSDGRTADFAYETKEIKGKVKKGLFSEKTKEKLYLLKEAHNPFYSNKASYNDRTQLISYDARQYPFSCQYTQNKKERARIHTFTSPSGSTTFAYDSPEAGKKGGSTTVFHPNGSQTVYRFNSILLVESMENYYDGRLINKKSYGYDSKQHLQSLTISDGEGHILIVRQFECDSVGNPIKETVSGDVGSYSVIRQFDQNRLVFESWDNGLQYAYTYLGNTHLHTSKKTLDSGNCLRETTYSYDKWNNLIEKTEVGRTTTTYSRYQTMPHLHRIQLEEKRDVNGNLLYKIHYHYDQWGNIAEEDHFDANGTFAYKVKRQYNESGDLLSESNPLNQTATFKYDARGRCIHEEPISNRLVIDREYDNKGNLLLLRENDWETRYCYNSSDELVEKTDHLGYVTKYSYHPIHHKPIRIATEDGVTEIVYDSFGREIKKIDSLGGVTEKQNNSYGDTTSITHPNGGKEFFSYFPSGRLQSHVSPGGLVTTYAYDFLGRVTQKIIGNQTHGYIYDGYHLIQKNDPAGHVTHYQYDLFDRKIQKNRAGRITRYGYDALGFRAWKERGSRRINTICDALGRVLNKTDGPVETRWTYDPAGNRASRNDACFTYDAHNRLVESVNDNGHKTTYQYEKNTKVTLNPRGVKTLEVYNHQDQLLAKYLNEEPIEERAYDPLFRPIRQDHLLFGYTPTGQKAFMQDGDLITRWSYTQDDLVALKQKPDGVCLLHEYDEQKRLVKVNNREFFYNDLNRIIGGNGFSRTLDPFGNILKETWDSGLWIEGQYDDWDRPLLRTLPDHSKIQYEYEGPLLKKITRTSKTGSVYTHTYDHFDSKGRPQIARGLFETTYEYDRCGSQTFQCSPYFTQSTLYDELGNIIQKGDKTYQYDALSQMTKESDSFTATYDSHYHLQTFNNCPVSKPAFDNNGNVLKPGFIYDEFDQLVVANGQTLTYDALGRRIKKGNTSFLYIGNEEIASFENGECKELNIDGIALEIDEKLYIPIQDVRGITRYLIDADTQAIVKENHCDPFGASLTNVIPYAYLGKRFDPETSLIYFGKRFYDPYLRQWITPDPLGPIDHSNLYQYVFNNPFSYCDPTGEFAFAIPLLIWGAELIIPSISTCVTAALYGAVAGAVAYGGYKALEAMNQQAYIPLWDSLIGDVSPETALWKKNNNRRSADEKGCGPFRGDQLGTDATKPPAEGFEWRGKGEPGSKRGNWHNPSTGESLRPDFDHPEPIAPHWDYVGPEAPDGARLYLDGTWEYK